jgi:hypothetical protein
MTGECVSAFSPRLAPGKAEYFFAGARMTQISLKLFNKLPFTRNEIKRLSRAGRILMSFYPRGSSGGSSSGLKIRRARA